MKPAFAKTSLILILGIFLLGSCSDMLKLPGVQLPDEGEGYFIPDINGVNTSRTIMPSVVQNDFRRYDFYFTSTSGRADRIVERNNSNLGNAIALEAGTWNLTVTAYMDTAKTMPAARGSLAGITITSGGSASGYLELKVIVETGATGTFRWNINFPADIITASITITPLNVTGTPQQTLYFTGGTPVIAKNNSASPLELNSGYYSVVFNIGNGTHSTGREEYLHIYQSMESYFAYTFTQEHLTVRSVTSGADSGPGTLRHAIENASAGNIIFIESNVKTITLNSRLEINKGLVIEGNGTIIAPGGSFAESAVSQLLYINSGNADVTIRRLHLRDAKALTNGSAICCISGNVTAESCIFSGNRTNQINAFGGAVYNSGTLTLKGCTFYGNSTSYRGGAVYNAGGTLSLCGNLFYGNTAAGSNPIICRSGGTVISSGNNAADIPPGTDAFQSGWTAGAGDKTINNLPVSQKTFRPLAGRGALNAFADLPSGYAAFDFYGSAVSYGAAAGAVQTIAGGSGFYLELAKNDESFGTLSEPPGSDTDGLYTGAVNINASPASGYVLSYWLVNGTRTAGNNPLQLPSLSAHTKVQAVFMRLVQVTAGSDAAGSENTAGTLRYALTNARDWDLIRFPESTPITVELTRALPQITKTISVEGNGSSLTRSQTWTSNTSQLLYINSASAIVNISKLRLKDGRAGSFGAAIRNENGNLTLESCILDGNKTTDSNASGGAIYNNATLTVKGCTFYGNNSAYQGGAILNNGGTLSLTGNLFYGNTAAANSGPVVYRIGGTVVSGGFNAVDAALGTGGSQCGWALAVGDKVVNNLSVSPVTFKLLYGSSAAGTIAVLPAGYAASDFYGKPINNGAASGAVQEQLNYTGYYLNLVVDVFAMGTVSVSPLPDANGLLTGAVTLTAAASPGYSLVYWLLNGSNVGGSNPYTLTLSGHTTVEARFPRIISVTSSSDENVRGTLRYALTDQQENDLIIFSGDAAGGTIELTKSLPLLTKSITIEGNSAVITRSPSWTAVDNSSQLLYINAGTSVVNINGMHFKNGRAGDYGAAIRNENGNLVLESCIFSGNMTTGSTAKGGAIYNNGNLTVRGCSFYANSSAYRGGTIYNNNGSLSLTGNLFYGNTAAVNSGAVVYRNNGTVTSGGFNAVNVAIGTGANQSGWAIPVPATDKVIGNTSNDLPFSPKTFRLISGGGAVGMINSLPSSYPAKDFYGQTISANASAGAVQAIRSGYYVDLAFNNQALGTVSFSPSDPDGLYTSLNLIAAGNPSMGAYGLAYWIVNGVRTGLSSANLSLTLTGHTKVEAVFGWIVDNFDDDANPVPGNFRHALANVSDGDMIWLSGVTAGVTAIQLTRTLNPIGKNLLIEGNGVTLTRHSTWTGVSGSSQLLNILEGANIVIRCTWFRDGMAYDYGGAIDNAGNLTLESCIFCSNSTTFDYAQGGALFNSGILNVKGCTFYGNKCSSTGIYGGSYGASIYNYGGTLNLTGNLFYGNTVNGAFDDWPVVFNNISMGGSISTLGRNVIDVPYGTGSTQSGWSAGTGDTRFTTLGITGLPFASVSGAGAFEPVTGLKNVMPSSPLADFPAADFYGQIRTWPGAPGAVK